MQKTNERPRALVACDEPTTRRELEQTFLDGGVAVVCAKDGREALEVLRNMDVPQFAVLDWLMAGIDGPGRLQLEADGAQALAERSQPVSRGGR